MIHYYDEELQNPTTRPHYTFHLLVGKDGHIYLELKTKEDDFLLHMSPTQAMVEVWSP